MARTANLLRAASAFWVMAFASLPAIAEPQLHPPQTNDAIIVPDGSQSWIPPRREDEDPITYKTGPKSGAAPETTAKPAQPSPDEIQSFDLPVTADSSWQCTPLIVTPGFAEKLFTTQQQIRQGDFAAAAAVINEAAKLAPGPTEQVSLTLQRTLLALKSGDKPAELASLTDLLAINCGLPPVLRDMFTGERQRLRHELDLPPD